MSARLIHKSASRSRNEARELLQLIFATELLQPSKSLWVVSPWLRDVPILDNRAGAFLALAPDLPRTEVRLTKLLRELVSRGTRITIATRPEPDGGAVGEALQADAPDLVIVRHMADLHAKGIVGDQYALIGSMNLTNNGIENLAELLQFETEPSHVEALRAEFRRYYGGGA